MRLIDADKVLKHKTDHDMISTHLIYNAPTVDAIPISWLEQHIKDAETLLWLEYARHLKSLLYTWNEKNDYSRAEREEE